ncbi:MAG: undecaprenyl-diphosphatase UppP [Chloroflexi bacterium RBG_13_48_10]|nr:MAG: undecaprenyl-diphosphatase UppP [Chloroflexi bacterium RBG_13_48_10]
MTLLQSILLGIIQGLTEFLPISSSAHLVITPYLLGWQIPAQEGFIFDVLVQLGTLLAVILYFRVELYRIIVGVLNGLIHRHPFSESQSRLGWMLVLATIPAVIAGILFKDPVERAFGSPVATGYLLLGTAALLVIAEFVGKRNRKVEDLSWLDTLLVGLFQAVSLLPGISRSGSTIAGGMIRDLERPAAARFSFLMSVPVMLGAGALAIMDLIKLPDFAAQLPTLMVGFITSTVVGFFSIRWLLAYLVKRRLYLFAIYCVVISAVVLLFTYFRS